MRRLLVAPLAGSLHRLSIPPATAPSWRRLRRRRSSGSTTARTTRVVTLEPWWHMQLPVFLMGSRSQVRGETIRFLDAVASGERPDVALVDAAAGGVIRLDEPLDLPYLDSLRDDRSFHLYLPLAIATKSRKSLRSRLVELFLGVSWGPLAMMGEDSLLLRMHDVLPEARWTEFLAATLRWWHEYSAEALRYSLRGAGVDRLWALNTALTQELRQRGVAVDELRVPLPDNSLDAFMRRHVGMFSDVLGLAQAGSVAGDS